MEKEELEKRFTYHPAKDDQPERYEKIRARCLALAKLINQMCPESREKSLAITELEKVEFWAIASIARNE